VKLTPSAPEPASPLPAPLAAAAAIGLIAGVIEVALMVVARLVFHRYTHRDPQLVWAAPTSLLLLCLLATLPLFPLARSGSATPARGWVIGIAGFLGALELTLLAERLHPLARLVLAAGVGVQAARLANRFPRRARGIVRIGGLTAAALTLLAGVAWYGGLAVQARRAEASLPAARPGAPNVLFLILDTMRASEMSLYGASRPTTPRLVDFARAGVVFDRAYSCRRSPWCSPLKGT
jgi:TRAP-type C4-dicarboxylate transport system permease small subunit